MKKDEKREKKKEEKVPVKKEEVKEIFKVEKDGEEKIVQAQGIEETKIKKEGQIKSQNKILKIFLIVIGLFSISFVLVFLSVNSSKNFEYRGIDWDVLKEGNVIFYHASLPMIYKGNEINYNVYLRNDPRKLEDVPVEGDLKMLEMMVVESSNNFVCDGYGGIAMINLQQIVGTFGMNVIKDPNATCDSEGRYLFVTMQEGDVTSIEKTGPACYNFNIKDCEVLKVTERFIIEVLVKLYKKP
jgi:hypothetical protein